MLAGNAGHWAVVILLAPYASCHVCGRDGLGILIEATGHYAVGSRSPFEALLAGKECRFAASLRPSSAIFALALPDQARSSDYAPSDTHAGGTGWSDGPAPSDMPPPQPRCHRCDRDTALTQIPIDDDIHFRAEVNCLTHVGKAHRRRSQFGAAQSVSLLNQIRE
jgi:hypothetical protein